MPRKSFNSKPTTKKEYKPRGTGGAPKGRGGASRDDKPAYKKDGERKPYGSRTSAGGDKKPYERKTGGFGGGDDKKPYERISRSSFGSDNSERKPYERKSSGFGGGDDKKPYERKGRSFDSDKKPIERTSRYGNPDDARNQPYERKTRGVDAGDKRPYERKTRSSFGDSERKPYERKSSGFGGDDKKPYERKSRSSFGDKKPFVRQSDIGDNGEREAFKGKPRISETGERRPFERGAKFPGADRKTYKKAGSKEFNAQKAYERKSALEKQKAEAREDDGTIRLNKYIANAGICSRREADTLIESGAVSVNGKVVTEMGYRVKPEDVINYGGQTLKRERHVYMLMNKPKDYITTTDDPKERKTVMNLIKHTGNERLYPVGRLDRNTTGLLVITNDGELAKKLTHPSSRIKKIYHVYLDKNLKVADYQQLLEGIELEDGFIKPDAVEYVSGAEDKKEIGVEMHSGRNRIVRRMFEHLGYVVVKLDRVTFAGLNKKDLPRGRSRYLTEKEVGMLKML